MGLNADMSLLSARVANYRWSASVISQGFWTWEVHNAVPRCEIRKAARLAVWQTADQSWMNARRGPDA